MENLDVRVEAVTALLANTSPASKAILSTTQATALIAAFQRVRPDVESLAVLAEKVSRCGFEVKDQQRVFAFIDALTRGSEVQGPRRSMQDYESFINYLSPEHWNFLLCPQQSVEAKIEMLFQHLLTLGLRNPSERTAKRCTVLIARVTHTDQSLLEFTHCKFFDALQAMKKKFKSMAKRWPQPPTYLDKLPTQPASLAISHRATYDSAFPASPPENSRLGSFDEFETKYACRNTGKGLSLQMQRCNSSQMMQLDSNPVVQCMNMMMQFMTKQRGNDDPRIDIFEQPRGDSTRSLAELRASAGLPSLQRKALPPPPAAASNLDAPSPSPSSRSTREELSPSSTGASPTVAEGHTASELPDEKRSDASASDQLPGQATAADQSKNQEAAPAFAKPQKPSWRAGRAVATR